MLRPLLALALAMPLWLGSGAAAPIDCAAAIDYVWDDEYAADPPEGAEVRTLVLAGDAASLAVRVTAAAATVGALHVRYAALEGAYFGLRAENPLVSYDHDLDEDGNGWASYGYGGGYPHSTISVGAEGVAVEGPTVREAADVVYPGGSALGFATYGGLRTTELLVAANAPLLCLEVVAWWTHGSATLEEFVGEARTLYAEDFRHGASARQDMLGGAGAALTTTFEAPGGVVGVFDAGWISVDAECTSPSNAANCDEGWAWLRDPTPGTWSFSIPARVGSLFEPPIVFAADAPPPRS